MSVCHASCSKCPTLNGDGERAFLPTGHSSAQHDYCRGDRRRGHPKVATSVSDQGCPCEH